MFWNEGRRPIHIEFIDVETGQCFARSEVPIDDLPASFEADTTLEIEDEKWQVERAEPVTSAEFAESGRLQLWLRRLREIYANPEDLLYSLPTITDEIPPVVPGSTKLGKHVLEIHEDDWRQVEFIALHWQDAIDTALAAIHRIYAEERVGIGFRNIHVRDEIPAPLDQTAIQFGEIRELLGTTPDIYEGVAYSGVAGLISGGFAMRLAPAIQLYGQQVEGVVKVLCLDPRDSIAVSSHEARRLAAFAAAKRVCLVDWPRAIQVMPDGEAFLHYFAESRRHGTG